MIHLSVEEYCHECERFEPRAAMLLSNGAHTLVTCKHKDVCRQMYEYLKWQKTKKAMEVLVNGHGETGDPRKPDPGSGAR